MISQFISLFGVFLGGGDLLSTWKPVLTARRYQTWEASMAANQAQATSRLGRDGFKA